MSFVVIFWLDIPFWYPNREWTLMLDYGLSNTTFEPPNHAFTFHSRKPHIHFYFYFFIFKGLFHVLFFTRNATQWVKKKSNNFIIYKNTIKNESANIYLQKKRFTFLSSHHCVKMQSQFLNVWNDNGCNINLAQKKM